MEEAHLSRSKQKAGKGQGRSKIAGYYDCCVGVRYTCKGEGRVEETGEGVEEAEPRGGEEGGGEWV